MSEIKNGNVNIEENKSETNELKTNPKNNKKIYINLIGIILTVIIGMVMIGIYPKIQEGKSKNVTFPLATYHLEGDLMKNTFTLYKEALEIQQGKDIEASDIYIKPESQFTNSNDYEVLKDKINSYLDNWKVNLENNFRNLDYVVLDNDENIIKSGNDTNLSTLIKSNDTDTLKKEYSFYITIKYNENGKMNVTNVYGGDENEIRSRLLDLKLSKIVYTNNYDIDKPIKNMTFVYGINKNLKYTDEISTIMQAGEESSYSKIVYIYALILAGIVTILSLLIPFKFEKEISLCKKFTKIPFEIIFILMSIIIAYMFAASGDLVFYTLNGDFVTKVLPRIGIDTNTGKVVIYLVNLFYWSIFIISIFISVAAIKNIFNVGLIKYFKEKTLTGIIIGFVKRNAKKTYKNVDNIIENVDLKDKSNKLISLICDIYRFIKNNLKKIYKNIDNMINNVDLSDRSNKFVISLVIINTIMNFTIAITFSAGCRLFVRSDGSLIMFSFIVLAAYNIVLFFVIRKYFNNIRNHFRILLNATNKIADGNLDAKIGEDVGLFNPFKKQIEKIQAGFKKAVDEEVKSQRMKTELISNVSHDLKTPLTSIITYVDLLKNENITEEERKSYIDTLDRKSQRLKFLIEDLFEVSKATSGNITLNLVQVDIAELMRQTQIELEDKINNADLKIKNNFPKNKVILELDSQKTFRILENLINNAVKYAMKGSRVYVDIIEAEENVEITMKNMSAEEINFSSFDIVERFQRGDKSRNTEGSGLGLAIVKSFVEAQGGKFKVEVDGDLFKAIITFKK